MPMLPNIYALLKASSAVTAILGTAPMKVYRHGIAPQGTTPPYVVWMLIGGDPENNLSGLPPVDRLVLQVDCYTTTDTGIEPLAEAVRDALEPHAHLTGIPINQRETDTGLYRIALQFDQWLNR